MSDKETLRRTVRENLEDIVSKLNEALLGRGLKRLEPVLKRLGRGGKVPHWFGELEANASLPNLDGKTLGSVVEMLLLAVLESHTLASLKLPPLRINPARGVDFPDLDLGIKSPSENYCTSEPFFSAYERIIGGEYESLVLLTDYQAAKKKPPLKLRITRYRYLTKTQLADAGLCAIALRNRDWLGALNEAWSKKVCRFLAFVNQSDWRAKVLLKLVASLQNSVEIAAILRAAEKDFKVQNAKRAKEDNSLLADSEIEAIRLIASITPLHLGVIDAADNWVVETQKEVGRYPSDNEWNRYLSSPLDGAIGMSFALQWRFNFDRTFRIRDEDV